MTKRLLSLLLTVVTVVALLAPCVMTVSAEDYPNTHVNTGDQRYDIVQVALTQLGYTESTTDTSGSSGYTKYGDFYGYPYADWCGCFVNWCARKAEVPTSVLPRTGLTNPSNWGLTAFTSSQRIPQPGDIFFKRNTSGSYAGHVGIVYQVDVANNICYTIEGNTGSRPSDGRAYIVKIVARTLSQHAYGSPNYGGSNNSSHTHSFSDHYEDAHPHKTYKKCDICGYVTYDGNTKTLDDCTECIQANCSHTYSDWTKASDSQHKRTCDKCGKTETGNHNWTDVKIIQEATCKEAGSKLQQCSICGAERNKSIPKTEDHDFGPWEYANDDKHRRSCSFCGTVETEEHKIDEETPWQTTEDEHWQECEICGEKFNRQDHDYGNDCVAPCQICEYVRPEGHEFSEEWLTDDESHWQECTACGELSTTEEHIYSAECDEDCDVCGYTREVEHTFGQAMKTDGASHWYECDVCGKIEGKGDHIPGAEATEENAQLCTVCDYVLAARIEHIHDFAPLESDGQMHWGTCRCGEILSPQNHSWDMATGACSVCGVRSVAETQSQNWEFVWYIIGGAVLCTVIVTACVAAHSRKKRREMEGDPYWA